MKTEEDLKKDLDRLAKEIERFAKVDVPVIMGVEAVRFVRINFEKEGFDSGSGVSTWKRRKRETRRTVGKRVLHNRGNLKSSIRYERTGNEIRVGVDGSAIPYAKLHNEGGTVAITAKMRAFFWAKYYEYGGKVKKDSKAKASVAAQDEANYWKSLALRKSPLQFPERKFLAPSTRMWQMINEEIEKRLRKNVRF